MISALTFFASSAFIEMIIVFLVCATILECAIRKRARRDDWHWPVATNVAGLCLLTALGLALRDAQAIWIVAALTGAMAAYFVDFSLRNWRMPDAAARARRDVL